MGIVKGKVVTRSGNPVANATVRGWVPGPLGGGCDCKTGSDGRFALEYAGVGSLAWVSVDGGEKDNDVPSGANLTLIK
jgi:hypothetical protein